MCSKGPTVRSLRSDSRAFSARAAAKAAASIAPDGGGAVLTAERPGLFDIVVLFPLASLPVAVAPRPPSPPPCLLCIKLPRLLPSLGPLTLALTTTTNSDKMALHITVLHHGFYVGEIFIWGGLARPNGRASKHDQMFIELNSLDLNVSTSSEVEAGETADHA